jgi:hypothetical protein
MFKYTLVSKGITDKNADLRRWRQSYRFSDRGRLSARMSRTGLAFYMGLKLDSHHTVNLIEIKNRERNSDLTKTRMFVSFDDAEFRVTASPKAGHSIAGRVVLGSSIRFLVANTPAVTSAEARLYWTF